MVSSNVKVVQTFLEAFAAGDIETAMSVLDPDVVVEEAESLPYPGRFVGTSGFLSIVAKMQEYLEAAIESIEVGDAGDFVVGQLQLTLTSRATGRKLTTQVVELYKVADGLIKHADVYYKDTKAVHDLAFGA